MGLVTLVLRLALIGQAPFTDEGIYVAGSYLVARHLREGGGDTVLPLFGGNGQVLYAGLSLYPNLLFFLNYIPGPPFFYWRMVDAVLASVASMAYFRFALRFLPLLGSAIAGVFWALAVNHPIFVDAGYKNPIVPATILLLAAFLVVSAANQSPKTLACGALIALSVAFREPFLFFIPSITLYILYRHGVRSLARFALSGAIAGATVWLSAAVLKGGIISGSAELLANYQNTVILYSSIISLGKTNIWANAQIAFSLFFQTTFWLLPFVVLGIVPSVTRQHAVAAPPRPGAGDSMPPPESLPARRDEILLVPVSLLLIVFPLLEVFGKIAFPYHFAQMLIGLALLAGAGAVNLRRLIGLLPTRTTRLFLTVTLGTAWFMVATTYYRNTLGRAFSDSRHFAPIMVRGDWESPVVHDSYYLSAAKVIRTSTQPDDRIIVSGFNLGLLPLSGRRPPCPAASDMMIFTLINTESSVSRWRALLDPTPDLVLVSNLYPLAAVTALWPTFTTDYSQVSTVLPGKRSYGTRSASIWKLRAAGDEGQLTTIQRE